jgi:Mitochondrial glycoprotein
MMIFSKISHSMLRHHLLRRGAGSNARSLFNSCFAESSLLADSVIAKTHNLKTNNFSAADTQKLYFSDSSAASLTSILEREINEENEDQTGEIPEDLAQLKREVETEWRIVDGVTPGSPSTALTRMYKKEASQNGSKIMIEFHCQDTEELGEDEDIEQPLEELSSHSVNFTVTVSRAGTRMIMDCATEETQIVVAGARLEDNDSGDATGALSKGSDATGYQVSGYTT